MARALRGQVPVPVRLFGYLPVRLLRYYGSLKYLCVFIHNTYVVCMYVCSCTNHTLAPTIFDRIFGEVLMCMCVYLCIYLCVCNICIDICKIFSFTLHFRLQLLKVSAIRMQFFYEKVSAMCI